LRTFVGFYPKQRRGEPIYWTFVPFRSEEHVHRGTLTMTPLEKLFRLEVEFHRRLREAAEERANVREAHRSFALQHGYEELIRAAGGAAAHDVELVRERLSMAGDVRDVLKARDSVKQLLGIEFLER
jgi:hypothetical protein